MRRIAVATLTTAAILAALLTLNISSAPAQTAPALVDLGRKGTYINHDGNPALGQVFATAQGQIVDGVRIRGRGAAKEVRGVKRFRDYYRLLKVWRGSWVVVARDDVDIVTSNNPAYFRDFTPERALCPYPAPAQWYQAQHSLATRWNDDHVVTRLVPSFKFQAPPLASDTVNCKAPPPPPSSSTTTSTTTAPVPTADVAVAKTASVASVPGAPDTNFAYTLTVRNLSTTTAASNVVVTDNLPAEVDLNGALPANCADTDTGAPIALRCTFGTLDPGEVNSVTINVTADASDFTDGTIANSAAVSSTTSDPATANNTSSVNVLVRPLADVAVDKTADQATVTVPGDAFRYVIRVSNTGPSDAANVVAVDDLPAGVALNGATALPAECTLIASTSSLDDFACDFGAVAAGATESVSIGVITTDERPDDTLPITNTATVRTSTYEQDTADNSDSATVTVTAA